MRRVPLRLAAASSVLLPLVGCARGATVDPSTLDVVASSAVAADFVRRIAGDLVSVEVLVPNSVDTHTYEPTPSELAALDRADLVVVADRDLNSTITQLASLAAPDAVFLDLNAAALGAEDFVYRDPETRTGRNVHTWTDPLLALRWIAPLQATLAELSPEDAGTLAANADILRSEIERLHERITESVAALPPPSRKLVVYHDAWEYFGRRYGFAVIGALQAANFAEPSAAEIAAMVEQIRTESVPAFFGSEVFSSDVMGALERESGARYVPDLADDELPGSPGDPEHSYVEMLSRAAALIAENLAP